MKTDSKLIAWTLLIILICTALMLSGCNPSTEIKTNEVYTVYKIESTDKSKINEYTAENKIYIDITFYDSVGKFAVGDTVQINVSHYGK